MRKMTGDEIRDTWLNFFASKGHYIEPSANLIPNNDPSLLWINAGVSALKKYFDGSKRPEHRRITNAQKCLRTNDIENVGHTSRHHTFFEMLGNFSIGDYFRNEVIPWAFELLTSDKYFGFPVEKLYVTYYPDDLETRNLWIKCGMIESHLVPLKSNFWEIGEGPCGPDTEIYFDRGEKYDPSNKGVAMLFNDEDNDRYIEIWNIVFSQYNAKKGLKREEYPELPQKNIDTGAGLERIACVIQGADTNFETDFFSPIISAIEANAKYSYQGEYKSSYRIIADHVRALTFTLSDGAMFSNESRGYVLRRLLRRAERHARKLGLQEGFLADLVNVCANSMSHFYPYLLENVDRVHKMVLQEEKRFSKTLSQGEDMLSHLLSKDGDIISGEDAFKLSDTYGFPVELTVEIAAENGKKVDTDTYYKLLNEQKERARKARKDLASFASQDKDFLEFVTPSEFTYEEKEIKSKVIGLFIDGKKVDELSSEGEVIFEKTNFYAESGGQASDTGTIVSDSLEAEVTSVIKAPNKQNLHSVKLLYGTIHIGDELVLKPDFIKRQATEKNHSAAHLFQAALQKVVSSDCHQAGQLVNDDEMRFDFTLDRKLTQDEIAQIEKLVNEQIASDIPCLTQVMDKEEALKTSAMHLFNEKYDEKVRVVSFGEVSKEFCGGTHVKSTSEIGLFTIVSEQAIASGVRRVVALTSYKAFEYLQEKSRLLLDLAKELGLSSTSGVLSKLQQVIQDKKNLLKEVETYKAKFAQAEVDKIKSDGKLINGTEVFVAKLTNYDKQQVNDVLNSLISVDSSAVLILNLKEKKSEICVGLNKTTLEKGYSANKLLKEVGQVLAGSGGGKNDVAYGGFADKSKLDVAQKLFEEKFN